jgi:exopolyphosphatase/guanosine-5'-triphosphate,3'-diphosphate pyrophosphatase
MSSEALAAIDLGTNTARLLIGRVEDGAIVRERVLRQITRLGGGFCRDRGISPEARQRTVAAMHEFAVAIRDHGVRHVKAVATSAVRDAANGDDFCREVRETTGIQLETIGGDLEGKLTLRGVLAGLDRRPDHLLVFDVGGGAPNIPLPLGTKSSLPEASPWGLSA